MDWSYVVVHHTGAEEKDAEQVRRYHLSLGWRDVGYHFLIERDGRLVRGRSLGLPGAHCAAANMNWRGIGVALIGNLQERPPTEAQAATLRELIFCLCRVWGLAPERVLGHREVPGASTLCPGRYLDPAALRQELARAWWGVLSIS